MTLRRCRRRCLLPLAAALVRVSQELAKVMLWLMVVGYTLRGMEVRWELERSVARGAGGSAFSQARKSWLESSIDTW